MKKILLLILFFDGTQAMAQLQTLLSHSVFCVPGKKPYVDINLSVNGSSLHKSRSATGLPTSAVRAAYLIYDQQDKIIYSDKLDIAAPEAKDSTSVEDFVHIQRVELQDGTYFLELFLQDKADTANVALLKDHFTLQSSDSLHFSDITFLDKASPSTQANVFSKNGIDMIPYPSQVFTTEQTRLLFYAELYQTALFFGKDPFVLNVRIVDFENGKEIPSFSILKKVASDTVIPLLEQFSIENLPSGNYELQIDVLSKQGEHISNQHAFFQRINKNYKAENDYAQLNTQGSFVSTMSLPQLNQYIQYLRPTSSQSEVLFEENLLKELDSTHMQQFMLGFWRKRNIEDPEKAWRAYLHEVQSANEQFTTQLQKGYETDRGRVFLQYGRPDYVNKSEYDRNVWPYEIWQYNKAKNQSNKHFVFALVNAGLSTDEYRLMHSDVIGELSNPRWQNELQKQKINDNDIDRLFRGKVPKNRFYGDDVLDRDY